MLLSLGAFAADTSKYDLMLDNAPLKDLFNYIESNSDYIILYNENEVDISQKLSIEIHEATVRQLLDSAMKNLQYEFRIYGRQIIVFKKLVSKSSMPPRTSVPRIINQPEQQSREISGRVTDSEGLPLPGVTVVIKGLGSGTVTNANGEFSIEVPSGYDILQFSFVGMKPQEVDISIKSIINVQMEVESVGIEDVVVIGYGIQKRESLIGAITVADNEILEKRGGTINLADALSGQLPGVSIMSRTGEPGREDPLILVRGQSTWNSASPLILVDGIERRMNDINVTEVASISVLKDASATAVFGVKGANGVVLITTKRGQEGKAKLSISASNTIKTISKTSKLAEAYTAKSWKNAGIEHEVSVHEPSWVYYEPYEQLLNYKKPQEYPNLYPNIDWPEVMLKDFSTNQQITLNVSGGTTLTKYFASIGYTHEGDIFNSGYNEVKNYNTSYSYDRINFRGNLDFDLTPSTKFAINLNGYSGIKKGANIYYPGWVFSSTYNLAPDMYIPQYPDGSYGYLPGFKNPPNVLATLNEAGVSRQNRIFIASDFKLEQKLNFITEGLSVNGRISFDNYFGSTGPDIVDGGNAGQALYKMIDPSILDAQTAQDSLSAVMYYHGSQFVNDYDWISRPWRISPERASSGSLRRSIFYQISLNYLRTFGLHDVSALFLFNRRKDATSANFPSYQEDWVGRVTYSYDAKYLFEINGAYNGSEKFGPGYRFGFFPSFAFGWMVSNENFMDGLDWISRLKIRGSIGLVGSDAGIPRWGYLDSWITGDNSVMRFGTVGQAYFGSNTGYFSGTYTPNSLYSIYDAYREGVIANPDINWETALKKNIGMELGLYQNKLIMEIDFFHDKRENIFMASSARNIPDYFGASPVAANIGETETRGFEFDATYRTSISKNFGYWFRASMTRARSVIIKAEDPEKMPAYQKSEGFTIGQTKTEIRTDISESWDDVYAQTSLENNTYKLPGDWDIIDFNGDGIISIYDNIPYGFAGNRPENTYSAFVGFDFWNFSILVQFYGVTNITQLIVPGNATPNLEKQSYLSELNIDYWYADNNDAVYKAPRVGTSSPNGEYYYFDGSFLRLKTLELSYNLPENLVSRIGLENFRFYVNGNDLLYWSDLPFDTETGHLDMTASYPRLKHFNFGIDIVF